MTRLDFFLKLLQTKFVPLCNSDYITICYYFKILKGRSTCWSLQIFIYVSYIHNSKIVLAIVCFAKKFICLIDLESTSRLKCYIISFRITYRFAMNMVDNYLKK